MKKNVSLLSLLDIHDLKDDTLLGSFLSDLDPNYFFKKASKSTLLKQAKSEINVIRNLIEFLSEEIYSFESLQVYNYYYYDYSLPQLSKQLDLLRLGDNYNINIELKKQLTSKKEILNQLVQNEYYMKNLQKPSFHFTYIKKDNLLYYFNSKNSSLEEKSPKFLLKKLSEQQTIQETQDLDTFFKPNNYIISPFNNTDRFLNNEYFLNDLQQKIKKEITEKLKDDNVKFIELTGEAGTGKTLLLYDLAYKFLVDGKKCIVFHCGHLNAGHGILSSKGWKIAPVWKQFDYDLDTFDYIFIDEIQRIHLNNFESIRDVTLKSKVKCIFCGDPEQWLDQREPDRKIFNKIGNLPFLFKAEKLDAKIRCNLELHHFISGMFNKRKINRDINYPNIDIVYFKSFDNVNSYLMDMEKKNKILCYTPSKKHDLPFERMLFAHDSNNPHHVIGQEFDNVIVVLDRNFGYDNSGLLGYSENFYYHPVKMLFQNVTRARQRLTLVVVNNPILLKSLLSIKRKPISIED